jgi:hypothetical protein
MNSALLLVSLAWMYVAVMMAAAEATAPDGSIFGALVTLLLYGVGPLAIVLYLMATPARRRLRREREATAAAQAASEPARAESAFDPDRSGHSTGDAVTPVREEP